MADEEDARALYNKATAFRLAGNTAEAVATFDEVILRYIAGPGPGVLLMAAMAMFNKGIALRDAQQDEAARQAFTRMVDVFGDSPLAEIRQRVAGSLLSRGAMETPPEALTTFNDFLLRFANAPEPERQTEVAVTLVNKGILLADAHRYEEAIVVFDAVLRRFNDNAGVEIRAHIARALYFKGSILMTYEPITATAAFNDLIQRFEQDISPAIVQVVQQARRSIETLKTSPPEPNRELRKILLEINYQSYQLPESVADVPAAAAHALNDPMEMAFAAELTPEYREAYMTLLANRLRDARQLHLMASALLTQCREQKRPFCLYLRNFDLEAYTRLGREPDGEERILNMSLGNEDPTERKIAAALTFRLPVIGISNPAINRPDFRHAVPKLELPNESWRETLAGLVQDAAFVVMHLETLTAGVSTELDLLQQLGKNNQTVVLIPKPKPPDAEPDGFEAAMGMFYGLPARPDPVGKDNPQLAKFPRVVYLEEVPFELLDLSPVFCDLLQQCQKIKQNQLN